MKNPIVAMYIDQLDVWYPPKEVLESVTVYLGDTTHLILSFWEQTGPLDVAKAWADGTFPADAIDQFHDLGIKVMVSAGGDSVEPITTDPNGGRQYGEELGRWATENCLDGVDFDIEDNAAFRDEPEVAIQWMVAATQGVRAVFPEAIISHAPQAPYFSPSYGNGPYLSISEEVGDDIDFYNIQFYNQGGSTYDSFETLFIKSNGWADETAVMQLVNSGVPLEKIVVGKPVLETDVVNSGYVTATQLAQMIHAANQEGLVPGGVMGWQYHSDQQSDDWTVTLYKALNA